MITQNPIRLEEYKQLVGEHQKTNRFERSLVIFGVVVAAEQYILSKILQETNDLAGLHEKQLVLSFLIPTILICVLYFNLSVVTNRIHSDARIVAYIQLFHEGYLFDKWIGWENSLRYYRRWVKLNPEKEIMIKMSFKKSGSHDYFSYLDILLSQYLLMIFTYIIWFVGILYSVKQYYTSQDLFYTVFIPLVIVLTAILVYIIYVPGKNIYFIILRDTIEQQRTTWSLVYLYYNKEWKRRIRLIPNFSE